MNDVETKKNRIIVILYYAILLAAFYLFMNYAFWLCYPFVFALVIALLLQKPVRFISKKTPIKRGLASALCVFVLLFVIGTLLYLVGFKLVTELKGFVSFVMAKLEDTTKLIDNIELWISTRIALLPDGIQGMLSSAVDSLFKNIEDLLASDTVAQTEQSASSSGFQFSWLTTPISGVISTATKIPSILVGVIITIVASCFLTSDYDRASAFIMRQFSEKKQEDFARTKTLLKESLGKLGKAYAIIIVITFVEMFAGLSVLKLAGIYEYGYLFVIALGTAVLDILPLFGTGTILWPWAIYSFITGNFGMGIGLIVIYGVISVVRQIVEPKLVAGQLGLSPVITLAALFIGLKLFGFIGMFVTPILVVMIKLLNDEGIIKLWKPTPKPEEPETPKPNIVDRMKSFAKKRAENKKTKK